MSRAFLIIIAIFLLSSCGFKPLYKKQEGGLYVQNEFAKIAIEMSDDSINSKELKFALARELNPRMIEADKEYVLKLNVAKEHSTTAIQKNTTITRYNIKLIVNFTLSKINPSKILEKNLVSITSSFDTSESGYSDYVVENFSIKNNFREICAEIQHKIGIILLKEQNENRS